MVRESAEERLLANAAKTRRLAQAYLISASGAEQARRTARDFLQSIFCESGTGCGACLECRKFRDGNQVDYLELGGGAIRLDDVRQVPDFIKKKSAGGRYKCIYIEDAHQMNVQSQNYLLKSMEEPEEGVVFVLSTNQPEKLLSTVISRCLWIRLRPLSRAALRERLEGKIPPERQEACIALCGGSWAEALRLAEDDELFAIRETAAEVCRHFAGRKNPSLFEMETRILSHEKRILDMLFAMAGLFRDGLYWKMTGETALLSNPDQRETAEMLAEHFTTSALRYILEILLERYEKKQSFPGYKNKLMVEGMLFQIMEVKAA